MPFSVFDLEKFKDKHSAEKVFMIGNGPSLSYNILDRLQGYTTIAMNNIALAFPHTDWRPTYYLNVTRSLRHDTYWQSLGMKAINAAEHSFIWARSILVLLKNAPDAGVTFLSCSNSPMWYKDKTATISRWGSSMHAALQIAEYMRFGQIFLLGCDLGYQLGAGNELQAHFTDNYLGPRKNSQIVGANLFVDEVRSYDAHVLASINLRKAGIHVYTCTKGPLTNMYNYVSFEDALEMERHYHTPGSPNE
jgi:hypothetical protein